MGQDTVSVRHPQAYGVVTAGSSRVAFEHGELRARRYDWRRRTPYNGIRGKYVSLVRRGLGGNPEEQTRQAQQSGQRERKVQVLFHCSTSMVGYQIAANHRLTARPFQSRADNLCISFVYLRKRLIPIA
jgi:hypothetical protein